MTFILSFIVAFGVAAILGQVLIPLLHRLKAGQAIREDGPTWHMSKQGTPTMGSMLGLKAFVAAVLGGIGSIPGAMIGGIAIGLCECFVSAIGLSAWKDAVTFAILIIVLLVKPTGFLGRKVQEKV